MAGSTRRNPGSGGAAGAPGGAWVPTGIMADLPAPVLDKLTAVAARLDLDPGVTFMREGEVTDFLAIVISGRVGLRMRVPERGSITILTLESGDIVGWSAVVDPFRATTSATTLERTELAILDAETLRAMIAADPEVAAAVLARVLQTVVARLAATRVQLLDLFQGREAEPW